MRRTVVSLILAVCAALGAAADSAAQSGVSYTVPSDNPFVGQDGARPEVWALGLRNPYRFSFDRTLGYMTIADVGGAQREEVNWLPIGKARGGNFGWPCTEGKTLGPSNWSCPTEGTLVPIFDYAHNGGARSITGGYVVRDPALPDLAGRYLFADFFDGRVRSIRYSQTIPGDTFRGVVINRLSSFGEDAAGHLYAADFDGGQVYRLLPGASTGSLTTSLVGTFSSPIFITSPPGDHTRLLVVERGGVIRLVKDGVVQATPFLDISDLVLPEGEQGLFSMAFAPDYATSKRFYVFYTDKAGNNRIEEFRRYTMDRASRASRRVVLVIEHPIGQNHNGGQLQFGRDGYLYASTGDRGGGVDPRTTAQNLGSLHGKILRINPVRP